MAKLCTLTVQDMLWIHLQLTRSSESFRFDRLEEATFLQYGIGSSKDILGQATRFLSISPQMRPFKSANMATAFVAFVAFLEVNDYHFDVSAEDSAAWLKNFWSDAATARNLVENAVSESHSHDVMGVPDRRKAIVTALNRYGITLSDLVLNEPAGALV